ncbi:BspA family leucine-rich repeat surface protein [Leuconostoc falkenbergense]|uniref:BspA family leucine-rich repeat surface protein n=1 Tax=Leuconostoc falkenbergense TaxID=2766470 RepID=UPI001FC8D3D0|nr:BspA family leucine-rich repeat surface protein [Leuconostoc falkenbergense]
MFSGAKSLTTLNLTDWGVNRTTINVSMGYMFSGTTGLTNLTLTNFKTTNVANMSFMFETSGVTSLNLSDWDVSR